MVEPWRWGLPWVVKGWVYWYESGFVVMGLGLGLSWVWAWVCHYGLLFFFVVLMVEEAGVDGLGFFFFFGC